MEYFATCFQGFGAILQHELADRGFEPRGRLGFDGRNDVVAFRGNAPQTVLALRTCEDAFVEVAAVVGDHELRPLVRKLADAQLDQALDLFSRSRGKLPRAPTFRVIVRIRSESHFRRTELRDSLTRAIGARRPRWRTGDPATVELWVLEVEPGLVRMGLRLTSANARSRGGRNIEREAALRPSAAAALCILAGPPSGGRLLDPCCGTGTILREARGLGWTALGGDIDPKAVAAATANLGADVEVRQWDARRLPLEADSVNAVVSNLPFGKRYSVEGSPSVWATELLVECIRVARPNSPIVFLAPESMLSPALEKTPLRVEQRHPVRLLGEAVMLWVLRGP